MDPRIKIPALALLGLSFTGCSPPSIVGDWRATQVNGQKAPFAWSGSLYGEQLHIGDDLLGDLTLYQETEEDGGWEVQEIIIDLVVDASEAPEFRLDAALDPFDDDDSLVLRCTLDDDTLTCQREDAEQLKNWVFTRIDPED